MHAAQKRSSNASTLLQHHDVAEALFIPFLGRGSKSSLEGLNSLQILRLDTRRGQHPVVRIIFQNLSKLDKSIHRL